MNGPGRYNAAATAARDTTKARGVILIVFGGERGDGFEGQLPPELMPMIPAILRDVADQIDATASLGAIVRELLTRPATTPQERAGADFLANILPVEHHPAGCLCGRHGRPN